MRRLLVGILVAAATLVAASMLGVAAAEAPTSASSTARLVAVSGVAEVPIAQEADKAAADGAYHQALAAAVEDGHMKAEVLASKAGATLGAVQTIEESGGSIECGVSGSGETETVNAYEGAQPDFGYAAAPRGGLEASAAPAAPQRLGKARAKKRKSKKHAVAASGTTCTLSARVELDYTLS